MRSTPTEDVELGAAMDLLELATPLTPEGWHALERIQRGRFDVQTECALLDLPDDEDEHVVDAMWGAYECASRADDRLFGDLYNEDEEGSW